MHKAIAADGTIAFVGSSVKQPPELFVRSAAGATTKVTNLNAAIASLGLVSAERITFPTATGIRADGILYFPPDFVTARKYPLVLMIHGGPTSSSTLAFSFWSQVMAARGWLVLEPNYGAATTSALRISDPCCMTRKRAPARTSWLPSTPFAHAVSSTVPASPSAAGRTAAS